MSTHGAYVLCIYAVWRFGFWALQRAGESFSLLVVSSSPHSQVGMKWRLSHKPSGVEQKAAKREFKRNKNRKRKPVSWTSTVSLPFTCISFFSTLFFYVFQHDDGTLISCIFFTLFSVPLFFCSFPICLCVNSSTHDKDDRAVVQSNNIFVTLFIFLTASALYT